VIQERCGAENYLTRRSSAAFGDVETPSRMAPYGRTVAPLAIARLLMRAPSAICLIAMMAASPLDVVAQVAVGPFAVGLATLEVEDSIRGTSDATHVVKVWLWFPLEASGSRHTTVRSLFSESPEHFSWLYDEPVSFGADSLALSAVLDIETRAAWAAPLRSEAQHLVVVGQGVGHPAFANYGTNELLASHGFVVASTAHGWDANGLSDLENQLRDFNVALHAARARLPTLESGTVTLLAHSAGAQAAVVAAAHGFDVDALALLDPSFLGVNEAAALRSEAGWESGLSVPTLLAMSHWWRLGSQPHPNLDAAIIDSFTGPRVTMDMRFMEHPDFVTLGHLSSETLDYAGAGLEYDFAGAGRGLAMTQTTLVHFLKWVLLEDSASLDILTRGVDGLEAAGTYSFRR